jgi:hypothetical protein
MSADAANLSNPNCNLIEAGAATLAKFVAFIFLFKAKLVTDERMGWEQTSE